MRLLARFIRVYTPFICTLMALINGVLFYSPIEYKVFKYLGSATCGYSVIVTLYFFATSRRMCIWYKLNLTCLLLIQILGIVYYFTRMEFNTYIYSTVLLSAFGIMCFLIFRLFYVVTDSLLCIDRRSIK